MSKKSAFSFLSLLLMATALSGTVYAGEETPGFAADKLSGNWNGARERLYNAGLTFDIYYKLDTWRNFSGGARKGNRTLDNLDLKMTVDGEKAANLHGTTAFVYLLNNFGGRPNDLAGSNGGIDNIEVPVRSPKLYEAWIQQEFKNGGISFLAGLHDLNSEFYVTDTSGLFLNPTYGIGTEMSATGDNGPSIFPYTSMAFRLALHPTDSVYLQAAMFDGVPGDPLHPRGTHIEFNDKDGSLFVAEGGVKNDVDGHFGMGVWGYTAARPDLVTPANKQHSGGFYFLADRSIYKNNDKVVDAFARLGVTAGDVEQFESNWSLGAVFSGFVPSRQDGQLGVAVSQNTNSDKYMTANAPLKRHETQWELTYKDKVLPWLTVQPDLQYTDNPGTDPALKNAWTGGVRFGADF